MGSQIHTKFTTDQVKELMKKYLNKEVERKYLYLQEILGIGKSSRFFALIQSYRDHSEAFSVESQRSKQTRSIDPPP
jgi:hypothetical protein